MAPVLAHAEVDGKQGKKKIFVAEKTVGLVGGRRGDLRAEVEQYLETGQTVDAQAEIDDEEVGIRGEVDGLAVNPWWDESAWFTLCGRRKMIVRGDAPSTK